MSTAWAYLAVSSDLQAESLPEQRAWADEAAALNGWSIDRYFQAVSTGKHGVRKLMQTLLEELESTPKARRPERVLMVRVDRTGRGNALDVIAAIAQIRKLGVTIHTRIDGDLRLETVAGSLKTIFEAVQAGFENEARSDRARAGHSAKRKAGKHAGHAPYGTILVDGKPAADEERAFVVREMFRLRLEGWGTHRLARHFSAIAPPKRRVGGGTRQLEWGENTVGRMLQCQTYRGLIVDEETFDAAQTVRNKQIGRIPKYEWPLRGAIRCTCGHMLSTSYSGPKRWRTRYYTCRHVAVHRERYPYHRADVLESQFVELLARLRTEPELFGQSAPDTADQERKRDEIRARLAELDVRRQRAWQMAEDAGIDRDELRKRLGELRSQAETLESELAEIQRSIDSAQSLTRSRESLVDVVAGLAEDWPRADIEMRREIARAVADVVGGIYVAPPERRGAANSTLRTGNQY